MIEENKPEGWVRIYRSLQNKGWYMNSEYIHLWLHLLLKANHKDKEIMFNGKNIIIKTGQFITGRKQLQKQTGINESKIERLLNFFEKSEHQIEQQKTNKNRLVTILNWELYQQTEQQTEQQLNNNCTTSEQQLNNNCTTSEHKQELKELKEVKELKELKKKGTPYVATQIEFQLSELLLSLIRKREPNFLQPNLQEWAKYIDKMISIDKRDPERIRQIIEWCQADEFWQNNILSTKKLKKQFDQLNMKMRNTRESRIEKRDREFLKGEENNE